MAEKEGFEPSKYPLFKPKISIGVYLVCAFVHFSKFYPHLPFCSGKEDMGSRNNRRTVLILFRVPSPIKKCT